MANKFDLNWWTVGGVIFHKISKLFVCGSINSNWIWSKFKRFISNTLHFLLLPFFPLCASINQSLCLSNFSLSRTCIICKMCLFLSNNVPVYVYVVRFFGLLLCHGDRCYDISLSLFLLPNIITIIQHQEKSYFLCGNECISSPHAHLNPSVCGTPAFQLLFNLFNKHFDKKITRWHIHI